MITIEPARWSDDAGGGRAESDTEIVRTLFRAYAATLPIDLSFQGFERELAELPGCYAEPGGCVLIARLADEVAGCVALRPWRPSDGRETQTTSPAGEEVPGALRPHHVFANAHAVAERDACEMKRLFVRDFARGRGVGARLARQIIAEATHRGYRRMLLDTLPTMTAANRLYESLGFRDVKPYYHNPNDARFMEKVFVDEA